MFQVAMRLSLMRKQPGIASMTNAVLTVLSVSPIEEDNSSLEAIIGHSRWTLLKADKLPPHGACYKATTFP